jgi:hypothetical protein
VVPVPSFVGSSSADDSESDWLQQMKTLIIQMARDMRNIHAMPAIIKKKGETAVDVERYALNELQKATDSLNCKYLVLLGFLSRVFEKNLLSASDFCILAFHQSLL